MRRNTSYRRGVSQRVRKSHAARVEREALARAITPVLESLEQRRLLSVNQTWVNDNWVLLIDNNNNGKADFQDIVTTSEATTEFGTPLSLAYGVQAFGNVQEGVADDAQQYKTINAAIANTDVQVNLLPGTYNEQVTLNKLVHLVGAGESTVIQPPSGSGIAITSSGHTSNPIKVSDLKVSQAPNWGIVASGIANLEISNVTVSQGGAHAIHLHNVSDATLLNIKANANAGSGINITSTGANTSSHDISVTNGKFWGNDIGVNIYAGANSNSVYNITIDGGNFQANNNIRAGIALYAEDGGSVENVDIGKDAVPPIILRGNGFFDPTPGLPGDEGGAGVLIRGNVQGVSIRADFRRDPLSPPAPEGTTRNAVGVMILGIDEVGTQSPQQISLQGSTFSGYEHLTPVISLGAPVPVSETQAVHVVAKPVGLDITGVTMNGTAVPPEAGHPDNFIIEDLVAHAVDFGGAGRVTWNDGYVYVTPDSFHTTMLTTAADLRRAIDAADAGDVILVKEGTYELNATLVINKPITLLGQTKGGVKLKPGAGFPTNGSLIRVGGGSLTAADSVTIRNIDLVGTNEGKTVNRGIEVPAGLPLGTLTVEDGRISDTSIQGLYISGNAVENVVLNGLVFARNGRDQGGSGDVLFWEFNNNATLTNVTFDGELVDSAARSRFALQFRGVNYGDDIEPLGSVVLDGVKVSGAYKNTGIAFQGYSDVANLSFNDVELGGEGTQLTGTWGALLRFDQVGSGDVGTSTATVNLGNTLFRGLSGDNAYTQVFDLEFAPDNNTTFLPADATQTR